MIEGLVYLDGIRYKMLECYIQTGFCLLPSLFSFTSNAVLHSLCPRGSVDMGHGGMSSTPHPSVILFGNLYETHCCTVEFHLACVRHRYQGIDKQGWEEEWQALCLHPTVTGRGTPLREPENSELLLCPLA